MVVEPEPEPSADALVPPFWGALVLGWILAELLIALAPLPELDAPTRAFVARLERERRGLAELDVRELRALPGLGDKRALAFARLRWQRAGVPPPLDEVPGIGEQTSERVARALAARADGARAPSPRDSAASAAAQRDERATRAR